jgi:hypothetical protein
MDAQKMVKETCGTVLNQLGKPTKLPNLKWIFQKFRNMNEAVIELKENIELLGPEFEKYYI